MNTLSLNDIKSAKLRIHSHIHQTPLIFSTQLNELLGHRIFFKAEGFQKTGSFKARGVLSTLTWMIEQNQRPKKIVTYSSGNHAQAIAWAGKKFGIPVEVYMPSHVSEVKLLATREYGAEVFLFESRAEAEERAQLSAHEGGTLIPPFDHDQVISGQGTACLEALHEIREPVDAIFTPCGGGGLLSGTTLCAKGLNQKTQVFGAEPLLANDAAQTLKQGHIVRWSDPPPTIADGARTLSITARTLKYLKQCDGIFELPEVEILYWTQWIQHLLKIQCETTSALGMAAASQYLTHANKTSFSQKTVLVILSGANIDQKTSSKVWEKNWLNAKPNNLNLNKCILDEIKNAVL